MARVWGGGVGQGPGRTQVGSARFARAWGGGRGLSNFFRLVQLFLDFPKYLQIGLECIGGAVGAADNP